jgi:DNA-binding NarL/FixJ family response regulator
VGTSDIEAESLSRDERISRDRALSVRPTDIVSTTHDKVIDTHAKDRAMRRRNPSVDLGAGIRRERRRELRARFDTLTEREREVVSHVVQGRLNTQIAWDLGIHERTVKLHRTAITTELGVPSVADSPI